MIKRRSKPRRVSVARDPKYLEFLRAPARCLACSEIGYHRGWGSIEAAHGPVNGMGSKGSDLEALPLCRSHHREQHRIGWTEFCLKYSINREAEVSVWNQRYKEMMNDESSK